MKCMWLAKINDLFRTTSDGLVNDQPKVQWLHQFDIEFLQQDGYRHCFFKLYNRDIPSASHHVLVLLGRHNTVDLQSQ